jgi:putative MATE family efflux protein
MLGSAVQNIIALTDSVFLYHLSETDFAAIGFVGVFYLVIAAIGYSFSKGGQIIIARRLGEGNPEEIGRTFYAMLYFEFGLAIAMFLFMQFGAEHFFALFVQSDTILLRSMEYLEYRSWGVYFSYLGVGIVALYTGVARTQFIVIDTFVLAIVNVCLNYGLIYGKWGLPEMGIAGAGLASTIAEGIAFILFFIYLINDKKAIPYRLFHLPRVDFELIRQMYRISSPVVAQSIVGLGSWFFFFSIVENIGERELAISNLARNVYLVLSIPCWGYASGINTLVSNFIGMKKRQVVFPIIWKTAKITLLTTLVFSLPVILFPKIFLYPLFGREDMTLIDESQIIFYILFVILILFSIGGIFFNGLTGTGATKYGLRIQFITTIIYVLYIYIVINVLHAGLVWAWTAEVWYWSMTLIMTYYYLRSRRWYELKV